MVLQLLRFSVLVSLVGLPLMLGARTVEERPKCWFRSSIRLASTTLPFF